PHPGAGRLELQVDPPRPGDRQVTVILGGGRLGHGAATVAARSAACWARCAAIHAAPHASRFSSRSAALTERTSCGDRASMIALVRPSLMAMGRNALPIAARSGMPNDTFDAPSVMFTPNSAVSSRIVSRVAFFFKVSAPT